jgi:hypothetical protein
MPACRADAGLSQRETATGGGLQVSIPFSPKYPARSLLCSKHEVAFGQ